MKRIVLWGLSTLSTVVLLFGYHTSTSGALAATASSPFESSAPAGTSTGSSPSSGSGAAGGSPDGNSGGSGSTKSKSSGSAGSPSPRAHPSGTTTVTGSVVGTVWGPVQVRLALSRNAITKVTVLQYPRGSSEDVVINNYALPILTRETLKHQSANIDMVSGATVTSAGYLQSLQSALDQAGL